MGSSPLDRGLFSVSAPACVMGILNATPDSFSGDGLGATPDPAAAVAQTQAMLEAGATWVDIGGESSRPGATPVAEDEEIRRTIPLIRAIRARWPDVPISLDTTKPAVAALGIEAGVSLINDISGCAVDPALYALARKGRVGLVLMHNQAQRAAVTACGRLGAAYDAPDPQEDIVARVVEDLRYAIAQAQAAGVPAEAIVLDPGLGFGKTVAQNLRLVRHVDQVVALGYPVLLGPSRKNFIGQILNLPPEDRLEGTAAIVALGVYHGARFLRVHDVRAMTRVVRMAQAVKDIG